MEPATKVAALTALAVAALGIGLLAMGWPADPTPLLPGAVATGLCLPTAIATLLLAEVVMRTAPDFGPLAVLVGTGLRMGAAVVGVVLLGEVVARFGVDRESFAVWVAYIYVVTLVAECGLLVLGRRRPGSGAVP